MTAAWAKAYIATVAVYGTFAHSRAAMDVIVSGAEIRNSQA